MATSITPQDILHGFFDILSTLQGIEYMACDSTTAESCETPAYYFGKLAGLLAQRQGALCSDLSTYLAQQERAMQQPHTVLPRT